MDSELILGLRISVLGLSLTFLAMGLVILVMVLLLRFFPAKDAAGHAKEETSTVVTGDSSEQDLEEMAVALAVGICLLEESGALANERSVAFQDPSLGRLLEE